MANVTMTGKTLQLKYDEQSNEGHPVCVCLVTNQATNHSVMLAVSGAHLAARTVSKPLRRQA